MKIKQQKFTVFLLSSMVFGLIFTVQAAKTTPAVINPNDKIISAFRQYKDVTLPTLKVPTVVEVPFSEDFLKKYDDRWKKKIGKTIQTWMLIFWPLRLPINLLRECQQEE
jgi:hypothetical protein